MAEQLTLSWTPRNSSSPVNAGNSTTNNSSTLDDNENSVNLVFPSQHDADSDAADPTATAPTANADGATDHAMGNPTDQSFDDRSNDSTDSWRPDSHSPQRTSRTLAVVKPRRRRMDEYDRSATPTMKPKRDSDRQLKFAVLGGLTTMYVILLLTVDKLSFVQALALIASIQLSTWFGAWFILLWRAKHVYRVKMISTKLRDWIPLSVPFKRKVFRHKAELSISGASAVKGSHMHIAMHVMSFGVSTILVVAIIHDLHARDSTMWTLQGRDDIVCWCLLLQAIGLPLLAVFELNMVDKWHVAMHYLGVVFVILGSIGYLLQQWDTEWLVFGVVTMVCQFTFVGLWCAGGFGVFAYLPVESNNIALVTRTSKTLLMLELLVFLTNAALSVGVVLGLGPQ